ncbi:sigma factor [Streptomyces mirabilis]|uniref:sigma factor n=1 Tax=Streptomyces TaxID=1883 RepID=UPI0029AECDC8|nr:sigma factor [Streptomyces sp. AK02-04a]MDX3758879.1 sigma factor [Streptomyces sp. AK02-04a]
MDFPAFVAARSAALFRGALVLTGSREAAEDLLQETLERTCRKWRTIAAKDAPDAYVRRITVNLANDRWRRFRRTPAHPDNGGDRAAPPTRRPSTPTASCARPAASASRPSRVSPPP